MNNRVILAPRFNLRVEDFGDNHVLALECMNCGSKGSVSAEFLRQNYKRNKRIKLVESDFRCEGCGQLGVCHWHVEEIDAEEQ